MELFLRLGAASRAAVRVVALENLLGCRQRQLLVQIRSVRFAVVVVEVIHIPAGRRSSLGRVGAVFAVQALRRRAQHVGEVRRMFHALEQPRVPCVQRAFLAVRWFHIIDDRHAFPSRAIGQLALHRAAIESAAIRRDASLHQLGERRDRVAILVAVVLVEFLSGAVRVALGRIDGRRRRSLARKILRRVHAVTSQGANAVNVALLILLHFQHGDHRRILRVRAENRIDLLQLRVEDAAAPTRHFTF